MQPLMVFSPFCFPELPVLLAAVFTSGEVLCEPCDEVEELGEVELGEVELCDDP